MKTIKLKLTLLIAVLVIAFQYGCNKMLDLKPINEISDASFWQSDDQFKLAANEFYNYLRTFQNVVDDGPHSELRSDLSGATGVAHSNGTNPLPTTDPNWNTSYTRLRAINNLLEKAAAYPRPTEIELYVAEAKFFRAYIYFDLLQMYGGVPITTR
jgi:hypothetical protein